MGNGATSGRRVTRSATDVSLNSRLSIVSRYKDFSLPVSEEALEFWSSAHRMSKEEVRVMWYRFKQLGPDQQGCISREVFRRPPYNTNLFCKQIWFRMPSLEQNSDKIPFEVFLKTARWWQSVSQEKKLRLLHLWMSRDGVMTADLLAKVFSHTRDELAEEEVREMATKSIQYMLETGRQDDEEFEEVLSLERGASADQFVRYIRSFPQEDLQGALHFDLTDLESQ